MRKFVEHSQGIIGELEEYFFEIPVDCPYGLPHKALYKQAPFGAVPDDLYGHFMASGYRRNGNYLYRMGCPDCCACVPIMIRPAEFSPNRNQKRVLNKNRDISSGFHPVYFDETSLDLCDKFLNSRYPGRGNRAQEYYAGFFVNNITSTSEIHYTVGNRLLGVAVVDMGTNWMNAVYFYFDPEEAGRSPGTFNILSLIDICRQRKIERLYLGYWIHEVKAMKYKAAFKPHHLLIDGNWQRVGK